MARLYVFVEGQTEQTFADTVLRPHLENWGVFIQGPILIAHAKKKRIVHRGGGRDYIATRNDIIRFLSQEKAANVFFTTMIDLHSIHSAFPGLEEGEKLRRLPEKRIEVLERAFENDIGDPLRFIGYIQLHEFEAGLFCEPARLASFFKLREKEIQALEAIANEYATPELIDDGQHSAPSKRIIAHIPDYASAKSRVGPMVAELIGVDTIRAKCPHFHNWLSRLENLGSS
jgi:hypothetical protein